MIVSVLIALGILFVLVKVIEKKSIYLPFGNIDETPSDFGMKYQDLILKTCDHQKINAWFIPAKNAGPTIFILHGNGGNLSHRLFKISFLHELGLNVFIVDYRGYGHSSGSPSETGLYRDARCGYEYLTRELKISPDNIVLYGESLGGAVAIDLASKEKVRALILEGVFTSVADMANRKLAFFPVIFINEKFDSLSKIDKIMVPKLFIHSRNDEVVPFELGKKLFDAAPEPKEFLEIHGGHNDAILNHTEVIRNRISGFIGKLTKEGV